MWDKLLMTSWNVQFDLNWIEILSTSSLVGMKAVCCDKKKYIKLNSQSQFLFLSFFSSKNITSRTFKLICEKNIARFAAFLTHFSTDRLKISLGSHLSLMFFFCEKHWRDEDFYGQAFVTLWWRNTYLYGMIKG